MKRSAPSGKAHKFTSKRMYFKYLDKLIETAPATSKCTISSVLVVRYLERIAEHATYICESVIYLATGEKTTLK
jgi:phosphate transport system protein